MIKVNLAPPTTKRPRRAAAAGGPELNLGLLFGGILAALVLIIVIGLLSLLTRIVTRNSTRV